MQYWDEISVRRAALKLIKNRATTIVHNGKKLYTQKDGSILWQPLIIQLTDFIGYHYKSSKVFFSPETVYNRDNNYCQYWHDYELIDGIPVIAKTHTHHCTEEDRTIDHIVPLSKGGERNSFLNTVCACKYCNEIIKKDHSLGACGLKLIRQPTIPVCNVGDLVIRKFIFNPNKPSHIEYIKLMNNSYWK
jgi:hypothetical protein